MESAVAQMNPLSAKKILFVITKSNWGGAQRYVYDLATHIPGSVVALGGYGPLKQKLEEKNVRTIFVQRFQRNISLTKETGAFFELLKIIKHERPDVVHLNSSKAGGLGALVARISNVPRIVFTVHGWPFLEKRNLAWQLFAFLGSWATALLSHTVIVVSRNDLRIGKKLPLCGHKMKLIYNGIDLSMSLGDGAIIRNAFPAGVRITGTVGELTANKNQIVLIEEARHQPDMYVAIVGEGEERTHLEAKIREYGLGNRVKLFGFIPAREVLCGFDVFSLPSLKEGLPYVLIEARAAGIPIRANHVGGVGEILDATDLNQFSFDQMLSKTLALYN